MTRETFQSIWKAMGIFPLSPITALVKVASTFNNRHSSMFEVKHLNIVSCTNFVNTEINVLQTATKKLLSFCFVWCTTAQEIFHLKSHHMFICLPRTHFVIMQQPHIYKLFWKKNCLKNCYSAHYYGRAKQITSTDLFQRHYLKFHEPVLRYNHSGALEIVMKL